MMMDVLSSQVPSSYPSMNPASLASPTPSVNSASASSHCEEDSMTISPSSYCAIDQCKNDVEIYRERGANMRAMNLLNTEVAGEKYKTNQTSTNTTGLTARQAANLKYEQKKQGKSEWKARTKVQREQFKPAPTLVVKQKKLAETTRRRRAFTADDVRDPETIAGMKCQLDWDREKEAQRRAQKLLGDIDTSGML